MIFLVAAGSSEKRSRKSGFAYDSAIFVVIVRAPLPTGSAPEQGL